MVVPYVVALHKHLVTSIDTCNHLSTMAAALRDSLVKRFGGILKRLRVVNGSWVDCPYNEDVYIVATVLDPDSALYWVEAELVGEESVLTKIKQELKGKSTKICTGYVYIAYIYYNMY